MEKIKIKSKIYKKIKKNIWTILTWIIFILVIIFAITALMSKFSIAGVKLFTVQSGSMEPIIKTGSMILVKTEKEYQIDNIVSFEDSKNPKKIITHRIVAKEADGIIRYTTKGDANEAADSGMILSTQIVGKMVLKIPYFGYPITFARTTIGFTILVIIPATIIIYEEVQNLKKEITNWRARKRKAQNGKERKKKSK